MRFFSKIQCALLALACLASIYSFAAPPFTVSPDGLEVTDAKTGLIWRRCAEGMMPSAGDCTGSPSTYTHEAALVFASAQTGWRLPSVQELSSIADRSRISPSIDIVAFPSTPSSYFWSSSPEIAPAKNAFVVGFQVGNIHSFTRVDSYHVRLVRAGQ
jgi:Protein of unknown function (DUF1566)